MLGTINNCTPWFVQPQTNKLQRLFKDFPVFKILQFSRTKIYLINRHSLTSFWSPYWLKHIINHNLQFLFLDHHWSHYFILLSATRLSKWLGMKQYLHLRYKNSNWNEKTEIKYCLCTKMFLHITCEFYRFVHRGSAKFSLAK